MCHVLGLHPLFIVRYAPKSYINLVRTEGGFVLIFKYQLYPHNAVAFAREVRDTLNLPVDAPTSIQEGTVQRFLKWHTIIFLQ